MMFSRVSIWCMYIGTLTHRPVDAPALRSMMFSPAAWGRNPQRGNSGLARPARGHRYLFLEADLELLREPRQIDAPPLPLRCPYSGTGRARAAISLP